MRLNFFVTSFLLIKILIASGALAAAEIGRVPVSGTGYTLKFLLEPADKIPLNQVFTLRLHLTDAQDKGVDFKCIKVDAQMPEHKHGMVLKPVIKNSNLGACDVSGMKLHMPGYWEVLAEVEVERKKYRLVLPYRL